MLVYRPAWGKNSELATERSRLLEDKRDKIREIKESRRNP
jgi:hypothetical protein